LYGFLQTANKLPPPKIEEEDDDDDDDDETLASSIKQSTQPRAKGRKKRKMEGYGL
jgi:hypothetical protein